MMKIQPYTAQELQIRKAKIESKLIETKEGLKTIRDVAELRPLSFEIDHSVIGKNIDKYI